MVSGSRACPCHKAISANIAAARIKLKTGPAATVAARAQSGAPCIVLRRSSDRIVPSADASAELAASLSPKNLT